VLLVILGSYAAVELLRDVDVVIMMTVLLVVVGTAGVCVVMVVGTEVRAVAEAFDGIRLVIEVTRVVAVVVGGWLEGRGLELIVLIVTKLICVVSVTAAVVVVVSAVVKVL